MNNETVVSGAPSCEFCKTACVRHQSARTGAQRWVCPGCQADFGAVEPREAAPDPRAATQQVTGEQLPVDRERKKNYRSSVPQMEPATEPCPQCGAEVAGLKDTRGKFLPRQGAAHKPDCVYAPKLTPMQQAEAEYRAQRAAKGDPVPATEHNSVNYPAHYTSHPSGVECITVTEHMTFNLGNAVKYIWRHGLKPTADAVEDLKKARWYLDREIARLLGGGK